MAERSFPLENTLYTAEEASLWFAPRTSGVHASDVLGVTASDGLSVTVAPGIAWLKYAEFAGVAYGNTEAKRLQLDAASTNYPRIDRIVIRYSKSENKVYLAVRKGTAGSTPAAPDIVRDANTYEISLAQVRINAGATSIASTNITDERLNNDVCGLMTDGVTPYAPEEEDTGGIDELYRVGDIYITTNSTSPASIFGGTWEQIRDRFLLAAGSTYAAGTSGGEAAHTLTANEIPSHYHDMAQQNTSAPNKLGLWDSYIQSNYQVLDQVYDSSQNIKAYFYGTRSTGGGAAHNNLPPYLAVYMWRRVA